METFFKPANSNGRQGKNIEGERMPLRKSATRACNRFEIVRHKEHKQAEGTQAGTAPPGRLPSPYLSSAGVYQVPGNAPTRCPVTGQRCPVNSGTPAKTDRATTPKPGNTTGQRPKTGVETGQPLPVARSLDSQLEPSPRGAQQQGRVKAGWRKAVPWVK